MKGFDKKDTEIMFPLVGKSKTGLNIKQSPRNPMGNPG